MRDPREWGEEPAPDSPAEGVTDAAPRPASSVSPEAPNPGSPHAPNPETRAAAAQAPAGDSAPTPHAGAVPSPNPGAVATPKAGSAPSVEPPSPDVERVGAESSMPGAHRGGFSRLPTAPVDIAQPVDREAQAAETAPWLTSEPEKPRRGLICGWALTFAIIGLLVSLFVGWGFLIGIVAIVAAIVALRRPLENRSVAVWALCIGAVSLIFSAGWLIYAAIATNLLGPGPTLGLFPLGLG